MIINDLDDYYIVFDTKNRNIELDTLVGNQNYFDYLFIKLFKALHQTYKWSSACISHQD